MFDIDKQKFGAFVAELRKEKGITQKELAERLFISDKAVSKWETASSIPDTALLIPLADILGVTVTELLMCRRIEQNNTMDTTQVEQVVKTAIAYSDEEQARAYQSKNKWGGIYLISLIIAALEILVAHLNGRISPCLIVAIILGAIFGVYYCFFAKTKLPTYYDENRICVYTDGLFEMNFPGLSFNNSNWQKILNVSRIWSIALMTIYPIISYIVNPLLSGIWKIAELFIALPFILGGLFIPVYIVGKRHE